MVKSVGMKKLFKNPKTRMRNLLLVILPFLVVAIICSVIFYKSITSITDTSSTTTYKKSIEEYGYYLRSNATDYQEELFKELEKALNADEIDKTQVAALVAENYVADYYTWTNKSGSYDIGGLYYVFSGSKNNYYFQSKEQFYKYLTYYINTYGSKNLIEVEDIVVEGSTAAGQYWIDGIGYDSYSVALSWTYINADTLTGVNITDPDGNKATFNDATKMYFTVIDDGDGRMEIVQCWSE